MTIRTEKVQYPARGKYVFSIRSSKQASKQAAS